MFRLMISIAALACGTAACAAPPADDAQAAASSIDSSKPFPIKPTTATAAPNQVFPPIPSFASLPPSSGDSDEDAQAPAETTRHSKKGRRAPVKKAPEMQAHMVVSDESHAYLANVETQLDALLQTPSRDKHVASGGVAVAMWH
jgi:hypothetical protein